MAIKILILDDEKEILESMRRMLELDERLEVITCQDPEEALERVVKENIQIVFSDIVMPQMDGLEFLRAAKAINGLIQIVMMSAYSTVDRVIQSLELGAADYLIKPFEKEELEGVLEGLIQKLERWKKLVVKARGIQDQEGAEEEPSAPKEELGEEEALRRIEELLKQRGPDLAQELLDWLEQESRPVVRERLLWALGEVLSQEIDKSILKRMLSSPDAFIRNGAIELARSMGKKVLPTLRELFSEGDKEVRKLVLDIAYFIPSEEAEALFLEAVNDPNPNIRMTAAEYLGDWGSQKVVSHLEERLFAEEESMLLATLFEALAKIEVSPRCREIINHFRERLDPIVAHSFLKYVGIFGEPEDLSWLEEYLKQGKLKFDRELIDAVLNIVKRHPSVELSDYLVELFEKAALSERKALAIYQILKLLHLVRPEKALSLAQKFAADPLEIRQEAAENFLAEIEDVLKVGEAHV